MGAQHSIKPWARGRRRAVLPTPRWSSVLGLRWVTVCLVLLAGCSQQMAEQPRHKPLDASTVFDDGRSARPLVPSTVARGQLRDDEQLYTGKSRGAPVDTLPFPVTREVLERGQVRFDIYCSPCHGRLGDGQGMVVQRGFTPPPPFTPIAYARRLLGTFLTSSAMASASCLIMPHKSLHAIDGQLSPIFVPCS